MRDDDRVVVAVGLHSLFEDTQELSLEQTGVDHVVEVDNVLETTGAAETVLAEVKANMAKTVRNCILKRLFEKVKG